VVDNKTLGLLFDMQHTTLHTLGLNRQADTWLEPGPIPNRLHKLRIGSLTFELGRHESRRGECWQGKLMAQNCKTLRHLELGFETDAAMDFLLLPIANDDHADFAQSRSFERTLREEFEALKASMSLNSLKVISWNVRRILSDKHWPTMDLRNLTKLVLEDCYALNEAFLLLSSFSTNPQDVRCLLNLDSFTFRQKYGPQCIRKHLRRFICSLPRGLRDLSVLMDEVGFNMSTESILRVHGKTLRTLIWDERSYR